MSDIEREERYIVIKRKHLDALAEDRLRAFLAVAEVHTGECVVVEHDWPNYEHVWQTIQQVANGTWRDKADGGAVPVPDGWRATQVEDNGIKGFIVGTPRESGVRTNTAVYEDSEDPAEKMLYLMLANTPPTGSES
jgi:hypothetical protein